MKLKVPFSFLNLFQDLVFQFSEKVYDFYLMNQGLRAGLLSIWLSGFLLIALSFYGTQLLSPTSLNDPFRYSGDSIAAAAPRITIFTSFNGEGNSQALLALRSWLALSSHITVVLFTQHKNNPSSDSSSFTDKFGSRLLLDSTVDFT